MEEKPWSVEPHPQAPERRRARIVAVDDDPDVRSVLSAWLSPVHRFLAVADAEALMRAMLEEPADLVILDVGLAEDDGWRVLSELRLRLSQRRTRVLFLTGSMTELEFLNRSDEGADAFLMKPVTRERLLDHVAALLR